MSQSAANVQVAIKKQSGLGTRATGTGATGFNIAPSQGIQGQMAPITSPTIGRDGMKTLDGLGSRKGSAAYQQVLGVGTQDLLWPALLRTTEQASFTITQTDVTSITTLADGIVGASGSFLADFAGSRLYRGMMVKLTNHSTAGNNGKWLPVLGVTAGKISVPTGYLAINAVADTAFTITVAKCWFSGATPEESYFTIEEWMQDILASELADDAKLAKCDIGGGPNAKLLGTFSFVARDFEYDDTTGTPVLTDPTYSDARELELSDGIIIINGEVRNIITDLSLSYDMGGSVPDVLGPVGPDVVLGNAGASGNLSAFRNDLEFLKQFRAKTPFEAFLVAKEPETDPADFVSFYVGNALLQTPTKQIAQDGLMADSVPFTAGRDQGGGDRARTVMLISTSAA